MPGDQVIIYIFSGANMTVEFTSHSRNDQGIVPVKIGTPFVDSTSYGEDRIYEISLAD